MGRGGSARPHDGRHVRHERMVAWGLLDHGASALTPEYTGVVYLAPRGDPEDIRVCPLAAAHPVGYRGAWCGSEWPGGVPGTTARPDRERRGPRRVGFLS